ncbi:MAG: hypothetical protein MKZ81_03020 [Dehalococcoidia bacterium]|nr:hypothetical protein [Dehalococcoidia bacterium]
MELFLLWVQLGVAAALILFAASYMASSADVIAERTGLGLTFVGVVLLATATSLPELGTSISSIRFVEQPDLAFGAAFGSNIFNLMIIGLLDLWWRNGPILNQVDKNTAILAKLGILIIVFSIACLFVHQTFSIDDYIFVSPMSLVLLLIFFLSIYVVYKYDAGESEEENTDAISTSLGKAFLNYGISATVVVAAAVWLAFVGDALADDLGWERSFVGTQFLAFSTSLPELAASFAALRINAPQLAISNVLGSNLFNMGFILFMDDLIYTDGSIWAVVESIHILTAVFAIIMTCVILVGLTSRGRSRPTKLLTFESILLIFMYIVTSVAIFSFA